MFLITELIALLSANLILMQALGTSTLFIAAGSGRKLVAAAGIITFFTTAGCASAYFVNSIIGKEYSDFRLLGYVLAVGVLYVLLLAVFYFAGRNKFEQSRKYIHISAYNCAVMGTIFTVSDKAAASAENFSPADYVSCGFEAGIGFIVASLILTAAYRKLNSSKVPSSFRGFPAMLVYLGIISMAVYSLI